MKNKKITAEVILLPRLRSKQLNIRLSEEEIKRIEKLVAKSKLSQSDYLRNCCLDKDIIVIEGLKEVHTELHKIGINLNQIAKAVNEGEIKDCSRELNELQKELGEIWRLLRDIRQQKSP